MKKKNIFLIVGILALVTGCTSKEKDTIKDISTIKYNGTELLYSCSTEEKENLKKSVNIVVKDNQTFIISNKDQELKTYQKGTHELLANSNADSCWFVDHNPVKNNKFGTSTAIKKNDPNHGLISITVYGNFTYRVNDATTFTKYYSDDETYLVLARTYLINHYASHISKLSYDEIIKEDKIAQEELENINKNISSGIELTEVVIEGIEIKNQKEEIIFQKNNK